MLFRSPTGSLPDGFEFVAESEVPQNATLVSSGNSVPESVELWQLRIAIEKAGLTSAINTVINSLPADQKLAASTKWEYKPDIERNHPLILALAGALKLTTQQVDDLFIAAAAIT